MSGRKIFSFFSLCAMLSLVLWGCAYSTQSRLPADIRTISVGVFGNNTEYLRVESQLTNAVIAALNRTPRYQAVNTNANAELSGEIVEVRNTVLNYDAKNQPRESRITVVVRFSLYDKIRNEFIFADRQITSSQDSTLAGRYFPDSGTGHDSALDAAVGEAAKVLVRNLMTAPQAQARREQRRMPAAN